MEQYSILQDLNECIEYAQKGQLNLYWQRKIEKECAGMNLSSEEQAAALALRNTLNGIAQWSDEEAICSEVEKAGGKVLFCKYFAEHDSFAELIQDCFGKYSIAFILDCEITAEQRKAAAQQVQQLLIQCAKNWKIELSKTPVPENAKYESLEQAASALMQAFDRPEEIRG